MTEVQVRKLSDTMYVPERRWRCGFLHGSWRGLCTDILMEDSYPRGSWAYRYCTRDSHGEAVRVLHLFGYVVGGEK